MAHTKIKLKISYEVECVLNPKLYEEGATDQDMIDTELQTARGDYAPELLETGIVNGTYKVEYEVVEQ